MSQSQLHICVIGTGYVGLTTGVCLAYTGHQVTCIDVDAAKVDTLRGGVSPIYEPGLEELMALARERLTFAVDHTACRDADVIILAVGTPPTPSGCADLSYVETAAAQVALHLAADKFQVVVNKSTVPIGSARRVQLVISNALARAGRAGHFTVASNPEFLREGAAVHDTLYPDRIVIGADSVAAVNTLRLMYAPILEQTFTAPEVCPRPERYQLPALVTTDVTSAEMIKYAANAFLATKISFINEIGGLCEKVGADVTEVARGIGLDRRIGSRFLQAGLGWGGSCFGKDTSALVATGREYGYDLPIVAAAVAVNKKQRLRVVEKLQATLKVVRGRTLGLLGLAFKPNTDDLRDAPALDIIRTLTELGAQVKVYDPVAMDNCRRQYPDLPVLYCRDALDLARDCDAVVIVTEWDEFRHLPLADLAAGMRGAKVLVDGRNIVSRQDAVDAGLTYVGFGR